MASHCYVTAGEDFFAHPLFVFSSYDQACDNINASQEYEYCLKKLPIQGDGDGSCVYVVVTEDDFGGCEEGHLQIFRGREEARVYSERISEKLNKEVDIIPCVIE